MENFRRLLRRRARESGFTVLELLVVVLVIGTLTSISVPVLNSQARLAVEATVQHDLRANVPVIYGAERAVFEDADLVLQLVSLTDENQAELVVSGDRVFADSWCFQVWHEFASGDRYYRHYTSLTSEFIAGECPPAPPLPVIEEEEPEPVPTATPPIIVEPPVVVTPPVVEPEPEVPEEGEVEGDPAEFNEAYTEGSVTYTPRYTFNAYGPGSATIRVEMTSTSPNLTEWHYVADLSKGPYFGFDPRNISYYDGQGTMTIENGQIHIRAINQWNGVSTNRSIAVTFTISNYLPPVMPEHYTVSVTRSQSSSPWYACLDVRVQGTNWFPVRWEHVIDVRSQFASLNSATPFYQNMVATPVEGGTSPYFVTLRGNSTNNNMVSATYSGHGQQQICYYPQGRQPFV